MELFLNDKIKTLLVSGTKEIFYPDIKLLYNKFKNNNYWQGLDNKIMEFEDHINIHKKNIEALIHAKEQTERYCVRLWDNDDIGRNLFFGNHVGCCTSIGGGNGFAASQHLMNSFVNGIEIVDRNGNSMGNSMCYFADVDGQLTFIIDSFEANGKLGAAPEVTDAIIEYAKQVCKRMGRADAKIMFGPNYNKLNFERCNKTECHSIQIIGVAPGETYIDAIGGHENINKLHTGCDMYEIIDL